MTTSDCAYIRTTLETSENVDDTYISVNGIKWKKREKGEILKLNDSINNINDSINHINNVQEFSVCKNLVGIEENKLYLCPPFKDNSYVTISAYDVAKVTTWTQVKFYDKDKNQIAYKQFDNDSGVSRTVNLGGDGTKEVHYVSFFHNCGTHIQVELGQEKTDFVFHFESELVKSLKRQENFGDFGIYFNEQAKIIANNLSSTRISPRLSFVHISDTHSGSFGYGKDLTDLSQAKFMVNTGDLVLDSFSDNYSGTSTRINELNKPCYITLGNHDVYKATTKEEIFTKYFSPIIEHNNQSDLTKTYYSIDYSEEKVKCLFLDCFDGLTDYTNMLTIINGSMSNEQINWLFSQLDDAVANDYHVCVFIHIAPDLVDKKIDKFFDDFNIDSKNVTFSFITDIINTFKNGGTVSFTHNEEEFTHTFTGNGKFVAYFCGHTHYDCIGYSKKYSDQIIVNVTRPWIATSQKGVDGTLRTSNDNWNNASYNYVTVDTSTRHVTIMKCGIQDTVYGYKRDILSLIY